MLQDHQLAVAEAGDALGVGGMQFVAVHRTHDHVGEVGEPGQHRTYRLVQLAQVVGLGDETGSPGLHATQGIGLCQVRGQHQGLDRALETLDPGDHLHAVEPGQADVEDDDIGGQLARHAHRIDAVVGLADDP
ncbi:hypothetical protein D3C71_1705920 [compost metagenome]